MSWRSAAVVFVCAAATFARAAADEAASPAPAETPAYRPLRVEEVVAARPVTGLRPAAFLWSPHGARYVYQVPADREDAAATVRVVDLASGRDRALLAAKTAARGSRSRAIEQIAWSPDDTHVAIVDAGTLEVVDVRSGRVRTVGPGADDPQFSPDGSALAFVRDGDLYAASLASDRGTPRVRRLTFSGSETVANGDPDWLYSEELDVAHGFAWSPDGREIAYLRFDDSSVAPFPIQTYARALNRVERQRYPLAGMANPKVSLRRVSALAPSRPIVVYDGAPHDEYLTSFGWTPDGRAVVDEILDRPQHHLRYERFGRDGRADVLASESDGRFVDVQPAPRLLNDGRTMLALSQRDGVQGLDRIDERTHAIRRLTSAPIAALAGVDERRGLAYVVALAPTRRDRSLLAVALDGSRTSDLTPERGVHDVVVPSHGGPAFLDTYSTLDLPGIVRRRALPGGERLAASTIVYAPPSLAGRGIARTRDVAIPSPEGPLDGALTVPADFDPQRRYPVLVKIYGGPLPVGDHASDRYPGLGPTLLAQRGVLTLSVDVPAERDDRAAYERTYAGAMGSVAIEGPLAAARWLATQPFADTNRLGLFGWSYGGYLTAFTMTHSHVFRSGIAGAPPTDWRLYDTAYTERYLGTPEREAAAYRRASVVAAAAHLSGSLLVLHGTSDDNVHIANTIRFVEACIAAGRPVQTFFFPGARHGPTGIAAQRYLEHLMLDWWTRTLAR